MNYGNEDTYFYIKKRPFSITPEDLFADIDTKKWVKADKKNLPKGRLDKACRCDRLKEVPYRVFNKFLNMVVDEMIEQRAQFKFPVKKDTRLYFDLKGRSYVMEKYKGSKAMEGLDFIKTNFRYFKPMISYSSMRRRYNKTVIITDPKLRKKFIKYQNEGVNYAASAVELTYTHFVPKLKSEFPCLAEKSIDYFLRLGLTRLDGALRRGCGFLSNKGFHVMSTDEIRQHYQVLVSLRRYGVIPKESKYWYIGIDGSTENTDILKTWQLHHYNSIEAIKATRLTDYEIYRIPKSEDEFKKLYKYRIINEEIEPELIWRWSKDRPKPPKHAK